MGNSGYEKNDPKTNKEGDDWLDYLSSHPSTFERIELAKRYSLCYKKGLTICDEHLSDQVIMHQK